MKAQQTGTVNVNTAPKLQHLAVTGLGRTSSVTSNQTNKKNHTMQKDSTLNIAFLGKDKDKDKDTRKSNVQYETSLKGGLNI